MKTLQKRVHGAPAPRQHTPEQKRALNAWLASNTPEPLPAIMPSETPDTPHPKPAPVDKTPEEKARIKRKGEDSRLRNLAAMEREVKASLAAYKAQQRARRR